eukprot:9124630-Pyramimonas_sp.AAC.1
MGGRPRAIGTWRSPRSVRALHHQGRLLMRAGLTARAARRLHSTGLSRDRRWGPASAFAANGGLLLLLEPLRQPAVDRIARPRRRRFHCVADWHVR